MYQGAGMSRIGRKRNNLAQRTANGRATRAGQEREFPPTQVKRLRDAAMAGLRDPEWGTELGRLYLEDAINHPMYAAGKRWREWAARYQQSIGVFPVKSPAAELGRGAMPPDPDSKEGMRIAKREAKGAEDFFEADAILMRAGSGIRSAVRRLCEDNEPVCGISELALVRTGLMHLVSHWDLTGNGLTNQQIRNSGRNAS